ncbi:MAG: Phosphoribosylformylglycinamidine synthase, PurS subunit [Phycisphaerales bacterium]|nr:Phosphoribosylformylglycinamidine synthase, PurS subunit [Phycisphaerales bacterium]
MIYRIDVRTRASQGEIDRAGEAVRREIAELGTKVGPIATWRIFLLDTPASREDVSRVASELLADPVVEEARSVEGQVTDPGKSRIEIHLKPGVMDPVADSTEMAIRDMGLSVREVRTGRAFVIDGVVDRAELQRIAGRVLANGVIESVHFDAFVPSEFATGHAYTLKLQHVNIRTLTDEQLTRLSREGHLFLSLPEMKAIQNYYREQNREPTDIELETLAQTWSEHCVHKTLKSAVDVEVKDETGKTIGHRKYANLIKETIFDSTMALMGKPTALRTQDFALRTDCLSVFADNAGVIAFDDTDAVCFKAETHNHPSAIEPYGGAATGAGGVIRDILGTGLAAKPIANTDVFCVAFPDYGKKTGTGTVSSSDHSTKTGTGTVSSSDSSFILHHSSLPKGVIHPKRVLQQVVAGVRDYGNRMGIPTVNGAVYFDNRYLGNPLVFCGCVGLIPRDKIDKAARPGDAVVVMGGRTGRDGIHGATFSSAELTDTHADEFSHAVQIGNAITEKKVADVILQARDRNLFTAITDCGAGGLSSAVGEMGEKIGATIHLDQVPLKYAGLRYDEIWISEAQERMVLSVPENQVQELLNLAKSEDVEATMIGTFGTKNAELILHHGATEVGRLSMHFLHKGIPMPTRRAVVTERPAQTSFPSSILHSPSSSSAPSQWKQSLLTALAHPNIASKHWIIRQYDHEVQGGSVIKPLIGPEQIGPSDAAVLRPKLNSYKGIALACGLAPHVADPYDMAIASIDEAIRNVVAVGADPAKTAILDNFCWPSVDDEKTMGTLVRACEACRDAALAHGIPFISGKDSLHNQFTNQETGEVLRIPNTLLISAISVLDDVRKCITMDLKHRTSRVAMVAAKRPADLANLAATHRLMHRFLATGQVSACHDISDGGLAVAAAEMCIASGLGLIVGAELFMTAEAFTESPGRYLVEFPDPTAIDALSKHFADTADVSEVGLTQHFRKLTITTEKERVLEISLEELTAAWRGTLDW